MSLDTLGGPAALAARIGEIESLVGARRAPGSGTTSGTVPASAPASASRFASVLGTLTTAAGTAAAPATTGESAVELAKTYTGVPYLWGGTDPEKGLDCSGLTQLVFRRLGVELPRVSRDQATVGQKVGSLAQARPGDLVFFGSPVHHVGIYAGDGKMVDAPRRGKTVGLHDVWDGVTAIRRVLPGTAAAGTAAAQPGAQPALSALSALSAGGGGTGAATSGAQALAGLLAATVPTATVNEVLASTAGYGPGAPGGVMGQAGAKLVPVGSGSAMSGTTATSGVSGLSALDARPATRGSAGWQAAPFADLFRAAGERYGVDPALLSAVAKGESGYRASARSHAGAVGLMQIMPGTARELGVDPGDPAQAVDGAARLLRSHLRTFGGDVDLALAAYNAGPGAVRRYDGVPPYAETRAYVGRVNDYWKDLR